MMNRAATRSLDTKKNVQQPDTAELLTASPVELLLILPERLESIEENSPEIAAVIRTMSQDSVEKYLVKVPFIRRAQVRCFNAALSLFLFPRPAHHTPSLSL